MDYYEQRNALYPYTYDYNDTSTSGPIVDGDPNNSPENSIIRDAVGTLAKFWEMAVDSLPKKLAICSPLSFSCDFVLQNRPLWRYWWDDKGGLDSETNQGNTVFVINEHSGPFTNHDVSIATMHFEVFLSRRCVGIISRGLH